MKLGDKQELLIRSLSPIPNHYTINGHNLIANQSTNHPNTLGRLGLTIVK